MRAMKTILVVFAIAMTAWPVSGLAGDALTFGILPVVDTLPLHVAREKGLFAQEGLDVELVAFQSALERDAALQSGKLDGYFGDLLNTILLISGSQRLGIVATAFHTQKDARMFGIVSAPESGLQTLEGLKGRTVAISKATVIEFLLDLILKKNGQPVDFVQKQDIKQIPIRLQMLLAGKVEAALLPEPLLTLAEIKGGKVLADDRGLDTSLTVLALKRELVEKDPELARRFIRAVSKAISMINAKPEAFRDIMMARTRIPAQAADHYRIPVFPEAVPPTPDDVAMAGEWLITQGMVPQKPSYEAVVVPGLR